ncbi:MAG: thiamine-phosphate kinase [Planctomycetota bacterium]
MNNTEDFITAWFASQSRLDEQRFPIGIGDDMAEVRIAGSTVLITTDMLLDGVHFDLRKVGPAQAGYKAMAASLSDCAAMATRPLCAVVSVALPKEFGAGQLKELHHGIICAGKPFGCELVGGDITRWKVRSGRFAVNVAMLSERVGNRAIRRNGAKAGDLICVTGALGAASAGRHLSFTPRVEEAIRLAAVVEIHSMIDISDGLSTDLNRICKASGVGAVIEASKIPISTEAMKSKNPLDSALNDGEDFELLFTVSAETQRVPETLDIGGVKITVIGNIRQGDEVGIKMEDGQVRALEPEGYDHLG